jgi:hypothetical protein
MKSEALTNLRTLRQIRSSAEVFSGRSVKTTGSLYRPIEEAEVPDSRVDPRLEVLREKERRRFASREQAVERAREHLLESRRKLSITISRNEALTKLRKELQRARREDFSSPSAGERECSFEEDVNCLEIRY